MSYVLDTSGAFSILYLNMEGTLLLYSLSKLSKSVSTEK